MPGPSNPWHSARRVHFVISMILCHATTIRNLLSQDINNIHGVDLKKPLKGRREGTDKMPAGEYWEEEEDCREDGDMDSVVS